MASVSAIGGVSAYAFASGGSLAIGSTATGASSSIGSRSIIGSRPTGSLTAGYRSRSLATFVSEALTSAMATGPGTGSFTESIQ
jgi:hypothetical protein